MAAERQVWGESFPRPSPIEWVCVLVGTALVLRYAWLMDDAYIYFRYIDNLVLHGRGLVYNAGEYVEGFTSPGWLLMLASFRSMGLDYWHITLGLGVLSYWAFAFLLIDVNRSLSGEARGPAINFPLVHLSACYGALCYFTSGLEAPLVQLSAAAFAAALLRPGSRALQVLVGLAPLVRPELLVPVAALFVYQLGAHRRWLPWMLATTGLTSGGWLLFRIYYYADLLPNTFYLKDEFLVRQGMLYLGDTLTTYYTIPILLCAGALYALLRQRGNIVKLVNYPRTTLLLVAAALTLYTIKIGGDGRHFRYLSFSYCLAIAATGGLLEQALSQRSRVRRPLPYVLGALALSLTLLCFPEQLERHPLQVRERDQVEAVHNINDAAVHRLNVEWTPATLSDPLMPAIPSERAAGEPKIIATWACAKAYRRPGSFVVQSLGLTEPVLARVNARSVRPGHKAALMPLADDIAAVRKRIGHGAGTFRRSAQQPNAARWIVDNLESLETLEAKMYNRHSLSENLRLAFMPVARIELPVEARR